MPKFNSKGLFPGLPEVDVLVDATKSITTIVRPRDVKKATPRDPENCAIAQSCKRTINGALLGVRIGTTFSYLHMGDRVERYKTATETGKMVKAYDMVEFFPTGVTAKLLPPPKGQRLGARSGKPQGGPHNGKGRPSVVSPGRGYNRHVLQVSPG